MDASLWYKDAIIYQLHVRAFSDSDADGIGDFRGLTSKLDYLADLGVTTVWLLPFYPSPLRDDGYDIADYTNVHPSYGTMRDLRLFLREARRHGLRVITELVMNHTSDEHPWFRRSRTAPEGSTERDFYVWSDTPERYRQARIIFKDFEVSNWAFDRDVGRYYWHRFYSHQPDLNFDNPDVHEAMFDVVDLWFEAGVDGLRLDAVPYLYEREGTTCENLPQTHGFLKELRRHVDERFADRMLLAEANQWPEDAAAYFGDGDECHMAFHFPVMPRMFMAIRQEDRFPIIDILEQTPAIPGDAQWAMFLRNHDELTLEMVTDEERDYMYRVYASDPQARINLGIRRRLAPLLGNDRRTIELMNGLLFSLPGTPVLYYGDEIGMGDNIYLGDRNGVRTPMQWSSDRNAGFSRANPQQLYLPVVLDPEYRPEAVNVEAQQNNPNSLLWWMKRLIALRRRYKAFGRGTIEFHRPENRKVLVFTRTYGDERILVVANLSRLVQAVELDLPEHRGLVPVELFGHTEFPPIGDLPYFLTLGPHAFYWFALEPARDRIEVRPSGPAVLQVAAWTDLFERRSAGRLAEVLPAHLAGTRWFGGKSRKIRAVRIEEAVPVRDGRSEPDAFLTLVGVEYTEGPPETYLLPLTVVSGARADDLREHFPNAVIATVRTPDGDLALVDATWEAGFSDRLLDVIARRRQLPGAAGRVIGSPTRTFRQLRGDDDIVPRVLGAEQSNTSIAFGERLVLKLFRRIDEGQNPDLEIGRMLTERAGFANVPAVAGALEYGRDRGEPRTLAILQSYVTNAGDAWQHTLDELGRYYERAATAPAGSAPGAEPHRHLLQLARSGPSQHAAAWVGSFLEDARLLGRRTAELHHALASVRDDPSFAPEPFTPHDQRALYQSIRSLVRRVFQTLRSRASAAPEANQVVDLEDEIIGRLRDLLEQPIATSRIRCHGDLHLGQVLYTGRDFVFIDFEGEPARPLSVRRIKRTPMTDVAGMLRSFHYAAYRPIVSHTVTTPADPAALEGWASIWTETVSAAFLGSYLDAAGGSELLPQTDKELEVLLDACLLEKAVYEIGYEASHRPDWLGIPIRGVLGLVENGGGDPERWSA